MAINSELFQLPAVRGDFTGPIITTVIALNSIARALEIIAGGIPSDPKAAAAYGQMIAKEVATIKESAGKIEATFDKLTGWTPEP